MACVILEKHESKTVKTAMGNFTGSQGCGLRFFPRELSIRSWLSSTCHPVFNSLSFWKTTTMNLPVLSSVKSDFPVVLTYVLTFYFPYTNTQALFLELFSTRVLK